MDVGGGSATATAGTGVQSCAGASCSGSGCAGPDSCSSTCASVATSATEPPSSVKITSPVGIGAADAAPSNSIDEILKDVKSTDVSKSGVPTSTGRVEPDSSKLELVKDVSSSGVDCRCEPMAAIAAADRPTSASEGILFIKASNSSSWAAAWAAVCAR